MLTDDGKHLYVSWEEYHQLTERLALKVRLKVLSPAPALWVGCQGPKR